MAREKISGIYCIENLVNGKKYIGLSKDIYNRWIKHKWALNNDRHINNHLQLSWNKYKENYFVFYIIETCNDIEKLKMLECKYIKNLKSNNRVFGYNNTSGGDGTSNKSDEILEKMSVNRTKNAVIQFDLEGKYLKKYRNAMKASNLTDNSRENIRRCCEKEWGRKTVGGYIWMYENDYLNNGIDLKNYIQGKGEKPVEQYDLQNNLITTYKSAREAENQTGIGYKMISRVCNGGRPYTHGYIFKFSN